MQGRQRRSFTDDYKRQAVDLVASSGRVKSTPAEIIDKLNKETNATLAYPKFRSQLADLGAVPMSMAPAEFEKFIAEETEKWGKVIRVANIKLE